MNPKIVILSQNMTHFWHLRGSFLTIFGGQQSRFWTFSKLFWSCLVSVWALFLILNGNFQVYFQPFLIFFATHTCYSPLGSRKALIIVDKASPGLILKAPIGLLRSFFDSKYFSYFWTCNRIFRLDFFWNASLDWDPFSVNSFYDLFSVWVIDLKFSNIFLCCLLDG